MADDPFGSIFGKEATADPFNDVFGRKEEPPPRNPAISRALGMEPAPDRVDPTGAEATLDFLKSQPAPDAFAIRRNERRMAEESAAEREANTLRPESDTEFYWMKFKRGISSALGGASRSQAAIYESLGLDQMAEVRTERAQEYEKKASAPIAGETTMDEAWARMTGGEYKDENGKVVPYTKPTAKVIANFIAEAGVESTPQMVMALASVPAYVYSLAGQIGQQRAENDNRTTADLADVLISAPVATISAYLDRLPLEAIFTRKLGATATKRIIAGAVAEGGTEGVQSGIEYAAGTVGTEKGFNAQEALKQIVMGSIAAAPMGGSLAGVTEGVGAVADKVGEARQRTAFDDMFGSPQGPAASEEAIRVLDPGSYDTGENRPMVPLNEGDIDSALPTDAIQAGKNIIGDLLNERPTPTRQKADRPTAGALPADIVQFFRGKGYSEAHARGITAGIVAESRGDHTIRNPDSDALGLGQWLGPRKAALIKKYGPNPTRQQQLEFLYEELQGGDAGGAAVLAAKDERGVLDAYITKFMRPAKGAETSGDISRGLAALGLGETAGVVGDLAAAAPIDALEGRRRAESPEAFLKEVLGEDILEPKKGERVNVTQNGETVPGTVEDAWEIEGRKGVRVALDDGTTFDEALDDAREFGARITKPVTQVESVAGNQLDSKVTPKVGGKVDVPVGTGQAEGVATADMGAVPKQVANYVDRYIAGEWRNKTAPPEIEQFAANHAQEIEAEFQRRAVEEPVESGEQVTSNTVETVLEDTSKPVKTDPVALVPQLREIITKSRIPLSNVKQIAAKMGVTTKDARAAMGVLASQPNSGFSMTKKGQLRRTPKRTAPLSAMEFVRSLGGVQSGSHDLRNVGAIGRHPGVISKKGRTLDEIGEALHEAGYFVDRDPGDPDQRPTVAETIDFLDRASQKRAYTAGDQREEQVSDEEQMAQQTSALEAEIEDSGHDLNDDERADAHRYLQDGYTPGAAVRAAMDDAAARVLDTGAEETGNDFYATVRDSIYEGEQPEERDGSAQKAVDGPEGVEGDSARSDTANAQPEAIAASRVAPASTAPEHEQVGVDDRELGEVVVEFADVLASQGVGEEQITHVFDPPAKGDIVRLGQKSRVYHKDHGWMSPAEAKAKIAEWEAHAVAQGNDPAARSINADKVVLSFFDLSGSWSEPWAQAGYDVYRFDIQDDPEVGDVNNFSTEFFNDWFGSFDGREIHAILSANPCTDFASSGARHFAAKDKDGRTVASVRLVQQTLAAIEYFKPAVWAIENPVGRIEKLGGLPPWRLSFDPNDVGDTYTKKTLIWGRFNADLPIAPVDPVEGSKMHRLYGGKSIATKNARSVTPEGFSYAFFMANNAVDHPAQAVAGQFDRLDRKLIERAIDAGVTPDEITTAVEDFYYQDLDDDAANAAIQALIDGEPTTDAVVEPTPEEIMGPRATDVRDTLQRKADERLIPSVEQKPVGSDGGLFDTQDTTGDLFAAPAAAPADPIDKVVNALQGAIEALKPTAAPVIQDAGEKIGGARKDMWAGRGLTLDDLNGMNQGEAFQFVTKDQVWPKPDYSALAEAGVTPETVAAVKLLRDSLAAKPKVDSDEGRRDYIEALGVARAAIGEPKTLDDLKGVQQRFYDAMGVETGYRIDRTEEGKAARRKMFSIFKGNTARFNVDYSMKRKIDKLVATGFPTSKAAPWTRRFEVRQAFRREGDGQWFVTNKQRRIVADDLPSKEAAEAKAAELYTALTTNEDGTKKAPDRPRLDNLKRTGEDVRGGRDISPEDFIAEFRFRGVEFGNWVAGDERQKSVNLAYEGLHDLASTLGIPAETLSLGGQLGLAFGARGSGSAAAHYEPGKLVINLTKTSGAGTLAHEWGHALDNYFGLLDSETGTRGAPIYASGGRGTYNFKGLGNLRPDLASSFDRLMQAIFTRDKTRAEQVRDTEQRIERMKGQIEHQKEALAAAKEKQGNHPSGRKFIKDSTDWIAANESVLLTLGERLADLRDEAKPTKPEKVESSFYAEAQKLSGKSGKQGYWSRPTELFARTFEAYVFDKIKDAGNVSQYLVQGVEPSRFESALFGGNPYPVGEERDRINAAYDDLFKQITLRSVPATADKPPIQVLAHAMANPFYSALERAVEKSQTVRANAGQWKATIANTPGVKAEEIEWSGLNEWLDMQQGQIERAAVLDVVRNGGIKIDEVILGGPIEDRLDRDFENDPFWVDEETDEETGAVAYVVRDSRYTDTPSGGFVERYDNEDQAEEHASLWNDELTAEATGTKFANWASDPSSDTYRELLITLPRGEGSNPDRAPSTHWDQDAVVAHTRFMDKRDSDGKRVLFVEEIQSDWHQKGRDQGYEQAADPEALAAAETARDEAQVRYGAASAALEAEARRLAVEFPDDIGAQNFDDRALYRREAAWRGAVLAGGGAEGGALVKEFDAAGLALNEALQAVDRVRSPSGIRDAPFKKSWPALVMKRLIRYAAENGYDRVAWTTGEEQAERYSLDKHISRIEFSDNSSGGIGKPDLEGPDSQGMLRAYSREGSEVISQFVRSPDEIADLIGRETADKLLAQSPREGRSAGLGVRLRSLEGLELRTGGEGMRAFYDRNLVNIANDLLKKQGVKVERVAIGLPRQGTPAYEAASLVADGEYAARAISDYGGEETVRRLIKALKADKAATIDGHEIKPTSEASSGYNDYAIVKRPNDAYKYDNYLGLEKYLDSFAALPAAREAYKAADRNTNPGFEITDALREAAVGTGFPLFKAGESPEQLLAKRQDEIMAAAVEQMKRLLPGDRVALKFASRIMIEGGGQAQGTYWMRVITLAVDGSYGPQWTLAHESVHAMKAMGLFTPTEWKLLVRAAMNHPGLWARVQKDWGSYNLNEEQLQEEAVAELFGEEWSIMHRTKSGKATFTSRMMYRLANFVLAVGRGVQKVLGIKPNAMMSATDLLNKMATGVIGARPEGFGEAARDRPMRPATVTFGRKTAQPGARLSVAGSINPSSPEFSDPETERRWKEAQKGIGDGPGTFDKAKEWWSDLTSGFTRHWRNLPNEARFSDIGQQFRKLEAAPEAAKETSVRYLRDLVGKMDKAEYDLFSRKVVLDDLAWEAGEDHELPFGLTPATLRAERQNIDGQIGLSPKLIEAVRKRKAHNKAIADAMVEAGVLTAEQIKNPAYFRHMVLDYARHEARAAKGPGSKIKSPYWAKRLGSTLDINANLLEAELDWMLKAQVDIATAKTIDWVKKSDHNIRERLRTEAKASNKAAIDEIIANDAAMAKEDGKFRQMIGMGHAKVKAELDAGTVGIIPAHLQKAADDLKNNVADGDSPFALFAWMLDNNKPGAMGAAMVLKYGGLRKAWMRKALGEKYLDPDDVADLVKKMKPEGFKAWQPIEGRHLFTAKTISESALDMFVGKLSETAYPGVDKDELHRALTTIRPQLVVGGDRYTMVLPEEVADTLTEFGDRRAEGMVGKVFSGMQGAWKRWVLINPRRFLKYNINNMTGDLDAIIAGNPGTLGKVKRAWTMLREASKGNVDPRYSEAVERGVFTSGLSIQEIPDINRLSALRHLTEDRGIANKLTVGAVAKVWRALQDSTQFRESLFRLAAYLDYVEKIEAGTPQLKIGYGASVPRMVDAVTDPKDKAALLARDLVGDYGSISVAGGWLRKYLIPFWSWTEINARRYWRLTNNAFSTSAKRGIATGGLLGVGVAARVAVSLGIRMGMVYGLLYLWNHLLFPDEEDDLGDLQKRQLHLILGRDQDGEVVTLRTQGALSDVLGLLGVPDAIAGLKAWENGQGSIGQAIKDTLKAPVNRVATATTPIFTVPLEQALGKELWPDIFNAREIKDRWRHVFETVSLEHEYDQVADKPTRGYLRSWTESLIYRRDPGEMAFDEAKGIAYDWLSNVKGQEPGGGTSPRSEALRDYRMALRYGDQESADEALLRYADFGGTDKGLATSIKRQHPLGPIAKKDRAEFLASLTDEQLDTFAEAEEWYKQVYLGEPPTGE